mgnify:CR=1 FL=1|jgi:RNA recognition motif-containing protein
MNKIYVGNLPYSATEEELRDMFSACGAIKEIAFIKDRYTQQCKGFSFIEFEDASSAQKAIDEFNDQDHNGRTLKVNIAQERTSGGNSSRSNEKARY